MRLSELGERRFLAELEHRGLARGIGDDAALLDDGLVATHDALVEEVHFRLGAISWRDLGYRAAAVNLSDLAASGADPDALLVALGVPAETELTDLLELYEGLAEAGVPVIGGDTTSAERVSVGVTALGHAERVPGRAGALPGDLLVVTGPLGAAGAAFRRGGFVRPPLRLVEGMRLAAHAHAMLDLSDGLGVDAARIAERSSCRLTIDLDQVRLAPGATVDDLGFGEDYELLAAVVDASGFEVIGRCEEGEGVQFRLDGRETELGGWEHFASKPPTQRGA